MSKSKWLAPKAQWLVEEFAKEAIKALIRGFWVLAALILRVILVPNMAPPAKPCSLVDTRVIDCGDNLEQMRKLPDACVDLIYIDYMRPRCVELGRVLKETRNFYYHCDWHSTCS